MPLAKENAGNPRVFNSKKDDYKNIIDIDMINKRALEI
jgi:hypothetical protein